MQPEHFQKKIAKAIAGIAWGAWNRLGVYGSGASCACSVDIEAALLLAAFAGLHDGRLLDGALSWLERYHAIVSTERLKILLRDVGGPVALRAVGAMCESVSMKDDGPRWRSFLKGVREGVANDHHETVMKSPSSAAWIARDEVFARWGLEVSRVTLSRKLAAHESIVSGNAIVRLRYLFGVIARADIMALIAAVTDAPVAGVRSTARRLSALTGFHPSSIFRVLQDLERGGFLAAASAQEGRNVSWRPTSFFLQSFAWKREGTVINWRHIVAAIASTHALAAGIGQESDETIRKHRLFEHLQSLALDIERSGAMPAPMVPSGPLEMARGDDLAGNIITSLSAVAEALTVTPSIRPTRKK
jgi:hypothetical protein